MYNSKRSSRLSIRLGIVAALSMPALAACQEALDVGVQNECGYDVEVSVESYRPEEVQYWTKMDASTSGYVASVFEDAATLYVWSRRSDVDAVRDFDVMVDELPSEPDDSRSDVVIVLTGERCPP